MALSSIASIASHILAHAIARPTDNFMNKRLSIKGDSMGVT